MIKNKTFYAGIAIVAIASGLVLSGCSTNKNAKQETSTPTAQTSSAPSNSNAGQPASGSKVEEAYVELRAQTTYAQTNNQSGWTAQNEKDLFAKYGVTKEEVDAFSKALRNDPARAKAVTIKQLQRLQELQKTGN